MPGKRCADDIIIMGTPRGRTSFVTLEGADSLRSTAVRSWHAASYFDFISESIKEAKVWR